MLAATILLAALIGGAIVLLAIRIAQAVRPLHEPSTRWVQRSGVDRRQRSVPVAIERRKGPRRQEEIAGRFLDELDRKRGPLVRRPAG
jgi:hypothetical protein